ncbi:GAD-like domain-containing protein [Rhizobium hainanense]|nr:GAD-like domain-containing protein [Rhizobium hainanense]
MSADEFLAARGKPRETMQVSEAEAAKAHGRVPADLIAFWVEHGVGYYSDRNYHLCMPFIFDDYLSDILDNAPNLRSEDFAAIGYSSLGAIDLWHRKGRHFTLSLDVTLLMDLTSRRETDPPPHDLHELYSLAGIEMPENAVELFLVVRKAPEDIWNILMSATSSDTYKFIEDENGRQLLPQLRKIHGSLSETEIYLREHPELANLATSYRRVNLAEPLGRRPSSVHYSFAVEIDGRQDIVDEVIPVVAPSQ